MIVLYAEHLLNRAFVRWPMKGVLAKCFTCDVRILMHEYCVVLILLFVALAFSVFQKTASKCKANSCLTLLV